MAVTYAKLFGYFPYFRVRKTWNTELEITFYVPMNKTGSSIENEFEICGEKNKSFAEPSLAAQIFALAAPETEEE